MPRPSSHPRGKPGRWIRLGESHERRHQTQQLGESPVMERGTVQLVQFHRLAHLQGPENIVPYLGSHGGLIERNTAFKVEIEAAVIHIGGAHDCHLIIRYEHLGVDKSGGVLIDLDAAPDQLGIIGTGHHVDIPFIRHMGCDDAHIDSALGGIDERSDHLIVQDQIGRRES